MAAKRKTLPKDFDELLRAGDLDALKAVFDKCALDAYGGYGKGTALHCYGVPDELARWLVEQGLDVDCVDTYKRTPMHSRAMLRGRSVKVFLELGANIEAVDGDGDTPLHMAAGNCNVCGAQELMEAGADINAVNRRGFTPLEKAVTHASNIDIENLAELCALFLARGTAITDGMREALTNVGKNFEFHRENFAKDSVEAVSAALFRLYEMFGAAPVERRVMHDGVSPIMVEPGDLRKQHNRLWKLLIPSQGPAKTVQGEVIRITGRVHDEIYRKGGGNWDKNYKIMLDALLTHLASGAALDAGLLQEAAGLAARVRKNGDGDDEPGRLCELAVMWVALNPVPVKLEKPAYNR